LLRTIPARVAAFPQRFYATAGAGVPEEQVLPDRFSGY